MTYVDPCVPPLSHSPTFLSVVIILLNFAFIIPLLFFTFYYTHVWPKQYASLSMFELVILHVVFWDLFLWLHTMFPIFINNVIVNSFSLLYNIQWQDCATNFLNNFHQWFLNFCYYQWILPWTLLYMCPGKHVLMFPMNQSFTRLNDLKTA